MMYRVLFFCALSFCLSSELKAKVVFNMSDNCLKAQAYLYELKLDEADKLLATEASANSENIAVNWLSESVIFLRIFTSEDQDLYNQKSKEWHKLIDKTEALTLNNVWYCFIISDMYIHRGLISLKYNK